ncbi:MAG: hypothetical protein V4496_06070 [Pseudomonadota bacterium]
MDLSQSKKKSTGAEPTKVYLYKIKPNDICNEMDALPESSPTFQGIGKSKTLRLLRLDINQKLNLYIKYHNRTLTQITETIFHRENQKKDKCPASLKAKVASKFLDYICKSGGISGADIYLEVYNGFIYCFYKNDSASILEIQNKFASLLDEHNLSAEAFFDVSNETIKLPEIIQKFLSPTTPFETEIAQLRKFIDHYNSFIVQATQKTINITTLFGERKISLTGLVESAAKTNVANALIAEYETENPNIKDRYLQSLTENGLTSDKFLSGQTKYFLSAALIEKLEDFAINVDNCAN